VTSPRGEPLRTRAGDFKPQIALIDVGLPMMDGYEVARHLAGSVDRPSLLVAISGYGLEADRARSKDAGFAEHLVKPIRVQLLRELLARASPASSEHVELARGARPRR